MAEQLNHVNDDPVVIQGCTRKEIIGLIQLGLISCLLPAILLALLFGHIILFIGFEIIFLMIFMAMATPWLGSLKEGKPVGYHSLRFHLWFARFFGSPLLTRVGRWEIGK